MAVQSVSKLDAATRQLHLAVDLHFKDADPIGIHTLGGAAHGLLRDLLEHRNGPVHASAANVQPAQRQFVERMVNKAKNFLKHADHDPKTVLLFNPDWTDFLLFEAIRMHIELTGDLPLPNVYFLLWLSGKYPTVLLLDKVVGNRMDELRRVFPLLLIGDTAAQKSTFRAAMDRRASRGADPS